MNKQEAIYRMFASRAAVLENESRKAAGRWIFERTDYGRLFKATEPSGHVHIIPADEIKSVALANLMDRMCSDLTR